METKIGKVLIGGKEAAAPPSSEASTTPANEAPVAPPVHIGKVYINGHEAVHKGCGGMAIAFPDVCLCPPGPPAGPVPVPLTNTVQAKDMVGGALTVVIQGYPAGHRDSYFATSTGNEVSRNTGGGITSHAVQGAAYFASSSRDVLIEGKYAVRDGDLVTQGHKNRMPANCPPSVWMGTVCPGTRPAGPPKKYTKILQEGDDEIHVMLVDVEGNALAYESYSLTTPSGTVVEARTLLDGAIHVKKVKSGRCELVLPNRDSNEFRERRTDPKQGSQRIRYRPCIPLDVVTGKTYEVEVPVRRSFWLHLNVDPTAATSQDDKFIMKSTDGAYECVLTVKDNLDLGKAGLTLDFPNLIAGLTYALVHDTGAEGEVRTILNRIPYDALFRTKPIEDE
jgi:hypothetical protein